MVRTVAFLLFDRVNALDVAGPAEAFATAVAADGKQAYIVETWSLGDRVVRSESGLRLCADHEVPGQSPTDRSGGADILVIPGGEGIRIGPALPLIAGWLQQQAAHFRYIASICTGAYALAESGLANGRCITTHWAHAADLQRRYPGVNVAADALYLRDGRFHSSGGVTAGVDLALDLIQRDLGSDAAMQVARQMVVFLRRTGGQEQFSLPLQMQAAAPRGLENLCAWAAGNLDKDLGVEALAGRAGMSSRQLSRRFRDAFGTPPAAYIKRLRLDSARALLDQGMTIAQASHAVGFISTDGFRRAFENCFGISPGEYRKRFQQ
ncbi:MAG: helix-turn-helix domain-containing protein [Pseudomonadota bacterium]